MPEGVGYSGSVAGTGLELNYIGGHCYAYSGKYNAENTDQTVLSFISSKEYIIGTLKFNGFIHDATPGTRNFSNCTVNFNGITVALMTVGPSDADAPHSEDTILLIPPLTNVEVLVDSLNQSDNNYITVLFTGRIYK